MISFDHASNTASKEWLTDVLTANGYLHSGEVVATDQRASRIGSTATSNFYELDIVDKAGHEADTKALAALFLSTVVLK